MKVWWNIVLLAHLYHHPDVDPLLPGSSLFHKSSLLWYHLDILCFYSSFDDIQQKLTQADYQTDSAVVPALFEVSFLWQKNKDWSTPVTGPLTSYPYCLAESPGQVDSCLLFVFSSLCFIAISSSSIASHCLFCWFCNGIFSIAILWTMSDIFSHSCSIFSSSLPFSWFVINWMEPSFYVHGEFCWYQHYIKPWWSLSFYHGFQLHPEFAGSLSQSTLCCAFTFMRLDFHLLLTRM